MPDQELTPDAFMSSQASAPPQASAPSQASAPPQASAALNPDTFSENEQPLYVNPNTPKPRGMVQPGNTDLRKLPVINNGDGSYSTLYSTSFTDDKRGSPTYGKDVLVRGILNGKRVDDLESPDKSKREAAQAAIQQEYYRTGKHIGVFEPGTDAQYKSETDPATAYGKQIHTDWEAGKIPGVQMGTPVGGSKPSASLPDPDTVDRLTTYHARQIAEIATRPPSYRGENQPNGYGALKLAPDPTPTAQDRFTRTPIAFGQSSDAPDPQTAYTSYAADPKFTAKMYGQGPASLIEANTGPDAVANSRMLRHEAIHALLSSSQADYGKVMADPVVKATAKPIVRIMKANGYKEDEDDKDPRDAVANLEHELPAYLGSFAVTGSNPKTHIPDEWTSGVTASMRNNYVTAFARALAKQDPKTAAKYQRMLMDSSPGTPVAKFGAEGKPQNSAPPVPAAPLPAALTGDDQVTTGGANEPHLPQFLVNGARNVVQGVEQFAQPGGRAKAGGASQILRGGMEAASPAVAGGLITAPLKTLGSLAVGMASQEGVERGLKKLGIAPEYSAFVGDLAGIFAGVGAHAVGSKAVEAIKAKYEPILKARAEQANVNPDTFMKAQPEPDKEATLETNRKEPAPPEPAAAEPARPAAAEPGITAGARPGVEPVRPAQIEPVAQPAAKAEPTKTAQISAGGPDIKLNEFHANRESPYASAARLVVTSSRKLTSEDIRTNFFKGHDISVEERQPSVFTSQGDPNTQIFIVQFHGPSGAHISAPEGIEQTLGLKPNERYVDKPVTGIPKVRQAPQSAEPAKAITPPAEGENSGEYFRGDWNVPLNETGRAQVEERAAATAGQFDRIVTGTKDRHAESAAIYAAANPQAPPPEQNPAFDPMHMGEHEGEPVTPERLQAVNDHIANRFNERIPGTGKFSGSPGESPGDWSRRLIGAVQDEIARWKPGEKTLIVTSGRPVQAIRGWVGGGMPADRSLDASILTQPWKTKPGEMARLDPRTGAIEDGDGAEKDGIYFARHGETDANANPAVPADVQKLQTGDERGGISPELLTLGAGKFIEHDVGPALSSVASGLRDTADDLLKAVAPTLRSRVAQVASLILRGRLGELARRSDQARYALRETLRWFNRQPIEENYEFMDRMEAARKQKTPELDTIAGVLRALLDGRRRDVQTLGTDKLQFFYENYFPHIWQRADRAANVFKAFFGERRLEGSKAFLHERQFPTIADGRAAGLKPLSDNPVELVLMKMREMDKYVMAHETLADWADEGIARKFPSRKGVPIGVPIGWKPVPDPVGAGGWHAPEEAVQVLTNYLSPGLGRFAAFRAATGLNNVMNLFNLGLSGFHLTKTAFEATVSKGAIGVEALLRGHPVTAAKNILAAPAAPFTAWLKGSKLLREWYRPGSQAGEIGAIMDNLTRGGARARLDEMYRTSIAQNMVKAMAQGNFPGAALRAPFAGMEALTRLIMDEVVPRLKMGAMADMAAFDLERLGPDASSGDVRRVMAETVNSVDNRMGEVARDNLFWHRYARDLSMFLMRADQYTLGTVREVGGAAVDVIRQPVKAARGEPVNLKRLSYVGSMLMFHMAYAALYQRLHTGKWPEEAKDYFYPKNGAMDEQGRPQRTSLMSYIKDVHALARHPVRTIENKAAPAITLFANLIHNADFYNVEIRHPDDPALDQAGELATGVAKQFEPRSIENALREAKAGASRETQAEQFFGLSPAPNDLNEGPGEKLAREIAASAASEEPRTRANAERRDLRQSLTRSLHAGKGIPEDVVAARKAGTLSKKDIQEAFHAARETSLERSFEHLGIEDAIRVYKRADPAERKDLQVMFLKKARTAIKNQPPATRPKVLEEVRAAIAAQ